MINLHSELPLFWWRDRPNFGDSLSPWLMNRLLGTSIRWSQAAGKFVAIGSVLWSALPGDIVWGTGVHPFQTHTHPTWSPGRVKFLAVRGPLTRAFVLARGGHCPEVYGDPAELLPEFYFPVAGARRIDVGIIPHIYDKLGRRFARKKRCTVIDPRRSWPEVVNQIASCRVIWSSSLHGLIIAEAYGIPAIWIRCSEGELKYRDYYSATDRPSIDPVEWTRAASSDPPPLPQRLPLDERPLVKSLRIWQRSAS